MNSVNLQLAILALDSYNRGYGAGLEDGLSPDGNPDGLGESGTSVGFADFLTSDNSIEGQAAGFYAEGYSVTSGDLLGKAVISFRGTDNIGRIC